MATPPPASAPAAVQVHPPDAGPQAYTPAHLAEKIVTARPALAGERKQVTVLFADLKDSTELIRGLDPEAAQQLLDPALHHMMDAVHRFEGTVNQVLGDGIMALFGAPIAHEDHALRACYAALAMQATMRAYTEEVRRTWGLELRMRVGLNSGEVVVRAIGNDLHMDYSAVGETTHLAARMEQLATPGSSRLTAATLRLAEGLVQVTAPGPVPVKGLEEPVEVFELVGASGVRRGQAAAARGLTPFVGRQPELETLHQAWHRRRQGHGQVVALVGEAGVGKSRLVYEVPPHRTGLAGAGERLGVLRQGHALFPRYRSAEAPLPWTTVMTCAPSGPRSPGRSNARRDTPGHSPRLAGASGRCAGRQPFSPTRPAAAPPAHARRAQTCVAAREPGAAPAPGVRGLTLD